MEDDFVYAPEDDEYYETAEYEAIGAHMHYIEEYDEHTFWETLAGKLAHPDLAAEEAASTATPLPDGDQ